jgi:flagellar hook-associated protein 2
LGFNVNQSLQDFLDGGSGSFTINDRLIEANFMDNTITVNGNIIVNRGANELRVQDMINAVNQSGAGVSLSFSALSGQFTMQHNQTGASNTINLDTGTTGAVTTGFLERIFNTDADGINGMVNSIGDDLVFQVAQNAEFLFNGAAATRETNNFMLNDITFNLAGIAMPDVGNANFNITVGRDTSNVRQMLVDFVEEYNALVRSLLDLTDVRRPRQEGDRGFFMPLTEEQRRGMSDREIEIWEEQARIGILHRDDTLRTIQQELTNVLFLNIRTEDGRTFNLGNAGIQLSPNTGEFGMLTINEDRLNFALEHHADALQQLFTATGGPLSSFSADPNAPAGQRSAIQQWGLEVGIADRLSHVFNRAISPSMGSITLRAGAVGTAFDNQNAMSRGIADQNRRIDNMLGWLQRREDSLFRQFSRMETAMMQAQSQMMFFEQLLWGGSGM